MSSKTKLTIIGLDYSINIISQTNLGNYMSLEKAIAYVETMKNKEELTRSDLKEF